MVDEEAELRSRRLWLCDTEYADAGGAPLTNYIVSPGGGGPNFCGGCLPGDSPPEAMHFFVAAYCIALGLKSKPSLSFK